MLLRIWGIIWKNKEQLIGLLRNSQLSEFMLCLENRVRAIDVYWYGLEKEKQLEIWVSTIQVLDEGNGKIETHKIDKVCMENSM